MTNQRSPPGLGATGPGHPSDGTPVNGGFFISRFFFIFQGMYRMFIRQVQWQGRIGRWFGAIVLVGLVLGGQPGARPAQAQAIDQTGYYTLVNRNSGKVLDVAARSTANGARVQQWADNGGANQQWQLIDVGGGYYKLINRNSGLSMEVANWSTASGEQIQQWDDNGGAWQQWRLVPVAAAGPIGWAAVAGAGLNGTTGGRGAPASPPPRSTSSKPTHSRRRRWSSRYPAR